MGLAASLVLPDYTPPQEVTTSPSPYFQEFSLESHHIGTNPASVMQHPGYYYYAAAMFTQRRLERFTLASQSTKMPQSSLANERKVDHRIVMLEVSPDIQYSYVSFLLTAVQVIYQGLRDVQEIHLQPISEPIHFPHRRPNRYHLS